jgi:rare lipoprotein A (peptidoglycan hydrolase)
MSTADMASNSSSLNGFSCKSWVGKASTYGRGDHTNGGPTASGQRFNRNRVSIAMRFVNPRGGHKITITNLKNGRSVKDVPVNDYGPAAWTRRIGDASTALANRLGYSGVVPVKITYCGSNDRPIFAARHRRHKG